LYKNFDTFDFFSSYVRVIPGFYRSHHEAIFEWVRGGMFDLAKAILKIEKCKKLKKKSINPPTQSLK